jgi:hypothetical protein
MRDYRPSNQEVKEYWDKCITLLKCEIISNNDVSCIAANKLGERIGSLMRYGMIDKIEEVVNEVSGYPEINWVEALASIRRLLDRDSDEIPSDIRLRIEAMEAKLRPDGIRDKLRSIVSMPEWRHQKDHNGNYIDVSIEEAEELAEQLSSQTAWYSELEHLLIGWGGRNYLGQ